VPIDSDISTHRSERLGKSALDHGWPVQHTITLGSTGTTRQTHRSAELMS